jgi:hypothetical protein
MAQFLGMGITHYPLLAGTDKHGEVASMDPRRSRHTGWLVRPGVMVTRRVAPAMRLVSPVPPTHEFSWAWGSAVKTVERGRP